MNKEEYIIPSRIQIEGVYGCNAWCTMCPVHSKSERKKGVMSLRFFKQIVDQMEPYKENISKFDLWALGETLLDKNLAEKIRYAKDKGFQNLAIATNVDLLTEEFAKSLFEARLDTIIFSIDGTTKKTQESIRVRTVFERIMKNALRTIEIRNEGDYKTRFVFRFIRQKVNYSEWEEFREFWKERVSEEKGDLVIGYDVHTWGGEIDIPIGGEEVIQKVPDHVPCHHVFDRLIVLRDGTVPLCCSDLHHAKYAFGNVKDSSPIEIFNNQIAKKFRKIHNTGKRNQMKICADCTILESELAQEIS